MFFCRVFVLILSVLATACVVCANLFDVFRRDIGGGSTKQTLWYSKATVGSGIKDLVRDSLCNEYKLFFQISEGVAVGGAAIGFIVLILAIVRLFMGRGSCFLRCFILFLTSAAFAGCGACVGLLVFGYMQGYCQNDDSLRDAYAPFKDRGYEFVEGFYLICVACGLFLFVNFFQCCA
ncbi:hypothetical protein DQ04_13341020 [Trypanosoma grayi]|uniref:hypothetical protein n=1 Tax=Trypanosoma grayi TaxID=71804 RepID=UPI0004F479EC|nr:hypothetical protein DQ04_13341020 [Trypanosoma grayi]KEG06561.1 hypothetical protein DQ04_13341020 [Trypanosoma grayi]